MPKIHRVQGVLASGKRWIADYKNGLDYPWWFVHLMCDDLEVSDVELDELKALLSQLKLKFKMVFVYTFSNYLPFADALKRAEEYKESAE